MNDTSDNAIRPSKERYTCLKTVDSHGCGLVFGSWAELKEHEKTHDALPLPWRFEVRNVAIADTGDYDGVIEIRASNGSVVAETWEATNEQEAAFRQIVEEMNRKPPQVETGVRHPDTDRLDWLQEELVDTIYMDDGRIIDVGGKHQGDLRKGIDARRTENGSAPTLKAGEEQP